MATKFYNIEKAAEVLGVTHAEVNAMRERQQLHGYRDGADWKFKAEEVDLLARQSADAGEEDVLLSEVEFGESDPGASGTVIGPPPSQQPGKKDAVDSTVSGFEELDLTLADSQLDMAVDSSPSLGSSLDLTGEELDDDDLVLGGSGSGSDITLGGDSGISLVDPTDSGLSLEEPLDLTGGSHESLELGEGEDDLLSLAEASNLGFAAAAAGEGDEFTLTPMDDGTGLDDDESGSQVVALEPEDAGAELEMAPMLDGDVGGPLGASTLEAVGHATAAPMGAVTDFGAAQAGPGVAALPEAPYTTWNIVSLSICAVFLAVIGMFMYDMTRNIWSWDQATPVTSALMDMILGR